MFKNIDIGIKSFLFSLKADCCTVYNSSKCPNNQKYPITTIQAFCAQLKSILVLMSCLHPVLVFCGLFFFNVYSSQIILLCNTQYFLTEEKLCSLTFQFSCCYIWFFIIVNVFCLKTQNITLQVVGTIVFKTSSTLYIEKTWQYQEGTDPPLPPFVKGQTD